MTPADRMVSSPARIGPRPAPARDRSASGAAHPAPAGARIAGDPDAAAAHPMLIQRTHGLRVPTSCRRGPAARSSCASTPARELPEAYRDRRSDAASVVVDRRRRGRASSTACRRSASCSRPRTTRLASSRLSQIAGRPALRLPRRDARRRTALLPGRDGDGVHRPRRAPEVQPPAPAPHRRPGLAHPARLPARAHRARLRHVGRRRPGGFYTKDDYRGSSRTRPSRHMIVVPEIDLPGHTHAVGRRLPRAGRGARADRRTSSTTVDALGGRLPTAGEPYTGLGGRLLVAADPRRGARTTSCAMSCGELAEMTPGPYLHIGGDEALGTAPDDFAAVRGARDRDRRRPRQDPGRLARSGRGDAHRRRHDRAVLGLRDADRRHATSRRALRAQRGGASSCRPPTRSTST